MTFGDEVAHPRLRRLLEQQTQPPDPPPDRRRSPMTATLTLPNLSTLPSAHWERVRDGIIDLDPAVAEETR